MRPSSSLIQTVSSFMTSTICCFLFGLPPVFSFTPESGFVLSGVDFTVPKSANSCVGNTVTGKLSLIPEKNISQKFWPWLQPSHKKVHGWPVLPMTYGHG